ncbi:MAG TPA: C4-type zinc ribbon domain-containing protein [Blastocatellia bacterium]|nr:C4-type zinc ribbon domain-containing protein [Blastocatellia bacterium]
MGPELSHLIELQELDLEIQRIADRLSRLPAEREQTESEFRQYAGEFLALKDRYEQLLADRKRLESELAVTQEHHEKYKQDLMRVRNEKEYTTALREIDATKKQISALETEVLKLMEEGEKLDAQLQVLSPDVEKKRAEFDRRLAALDEEMQAVNRQQAALGERRKRITETIKPHLLAMYERVARFRRGQALAEVRDGICIACRVKVRPKVFSDVRRGDQLITCDNCSRILYYRPEPAPSAEMAVSQEGEK